ncbi:hypothetical protein BS17DRAFT_391840 [Gyrodon lividus]|nr:hypothetical protein BS17DRAFT_391840 [Gyrodon lividus]
MPREDVKSRLESKYGLTVQQDTRQPLPQVNVDIPLVTPGFNASSLPSENRMGSAVPQFEIIIHPAHPTSASIVKSSDHTRSQSSEVPRAQPDQPLVVERSRTDPHGADPSPGHRMSIHESSRVLPTSMSRSQSYVRGNPETGVENVSSTHAHARLPPRSTHRISTSNVVPPVVAGPRPLRSASQGLQTNEPPTRPLSVAHNAPVMVSMPNQQSVPPSSADRTNISTVKTEHVHGSLPPVQPSPKDTQSHIGAHHRGLLSSHSMPIHRAPSGPPTPLVLPQTLNSSSQPSTRHGAYLQAAGTHQHQADQQSTTENLFEPRQMTSQASNAGTVKASWVVQTAASAAAKDATMSREDKYLRDHQLNVDTPYGAHAQLRQVLSQDEDPFPRVTSSIMKVSQAMTPPTSLRRNSPDSKAKEVQLGTPRGITANASPNSAQLRDAPTPEHLPRQDLPHPSSSTMGPPQIAVVGATPVAKARDLPHQGRVDHALLAPPFPTPARSPRTVSSSRDQRSQPSKPAPRDAPPVSYQPQPTPRNVPSVPYQPQPAPAVHAPSVFQPYPPPHPPLEEENGQFSPPPLPVPPPRGPEDSPPPPIETRSTEIIPARWQSHKDLEGNMDSVPQLPDDMLQKPIQLTVHSQASFTPPVYTQQTWQTRRSENNAAPTTMRAGSLTIPQVDVRSPRPSNLPAVQPPAQPDGGANSAAHQGATRFASAPQAQPSAPPTRPRPKVTIEDVPEDSPVFGNTISTSPLPMTPSVPTPRPTQAPQQTTVGNTSLASAKVATANQGTVRSSPQSRVKDSPLHRATESSSAPLVAPPMPPPTPVPYAPTSTRTPLSAPPTQAMFFPSAESASAQRSASQTGSSRTYQRAAEMLQTTKPSTTSAATYPITTANHHVNPPMSSTMAQVLATKSLPSASTTTHAAAASYANKVAIAHTHGSQATTSSVPPADALGLHDVPPISGGINTQMSSVETHKHQSSRPAALVTTKSLDPAPVTLTSSTTKNQNQEHVVDSTRPRDVTLSATRNPPSSHVYPTSARPGTSTTTSQQTHHVPPVQPLTHHRAVSLPVTQPPAPPSPRKYSQPVPSTIVSTQPFPSRPPQPAWVPVSGHLSTPAPPRSTRLPPPPDRAMCNDSEMLKTPSSIAPSPMPTPTPTTSVLQSITVPIRTRQSSTDSKDSKKKPANFFGLFRTKSGSSKPLDPPVASKTTRVSLDHQRVHTDVPHTAASATTPAPALQRVASSSAPKELKERGAPRPAVSPHAGTQPRAKGKAPDPIIIPPPQKQAAREHKDTVPHMFTPFKFLTMHSKRNRTISGVSLDVCDGNTAVIRCLFSFVDPWLICPGSE